MNIISSANQQHQKKFCQVVQSILLIQSMYDQKLSEQLNSQMEHFLTMIENNTKFRRNDSTITHQTNSTFSIEWSCQRL
jgi:Rod binding domain-containing protein